MQRLLVISSKLTPGEVEHKQLDGFEHHRRSLRKRLGLTVEREVAEGTATLSRALKTAQADAVIFLVDFSTPPVPLVEAVAEASSARSRRPVVFLDTADQTSTPFLGLLPFVDRYVKKVLLKDVEMYARPVRGGYLFVEYFAQRFGHDLDGWHFGSQPPDMAEARQKLVPGWNFGACREYERLLFASRILAPPWRRRPIAVNARLGLRAGTHPQDWYGIYRRKAADELDKLRLAHTVTPGERVPRRQYRRELLRSKVVVSPFGYGEMCFRDYEAVAAGALLVKPDIGHLQTSPDVFEPNVTYVPVKWDLSDLTETVDAWLKQPERAAEVAAEAQRRLRRYYADGGFVNDVRRALTGVVDMPAAG
ncbi:MAG: glycosyltransferase [Phycisphaerae bacterium]